MKSKKILYFYISSYSQNIIAKNLENQPHSSCSIDWMKLFCGWQFPGFESDIKIDKE